MAGWWSRLFGRRAAPPARALPAPQPTPTPELADAGGGISPARLDQALKRLQDEHPPLEPPGQE